LFLAFIFQGTLNSRPRKCLDDKIPYETFLASTGIDVKNILMGYALIT
jgi:hypothetical protein